MLTELFSPTIIAERVAGMLANYDFITPRRSAISRRGWTQAPMDADFALAYVKRARAHRRTAAGVLAVLRTKCDILWASSMRCTLPM